MSTRAERTGDFGCVVDSPRDVEASCTACCRAGTASWPRFFSPPAVVPLRSPGASSRIVASDAAAVTTMPVAGDVSSATEPATAAPSPCMVSIPELCRPRACPLSSSGVSAIRRSWSSSPDAYPRVASGSHRPASGVGGPASADTARGQPDPAATRGPFCPLLPHRDGPGSHGGTVLRDRRLLTERILPTASPMP